VRLTARHGRRIRITEQGARVLIWAADVLTRTHELQRELSDSIAGRKGSVVLGTSMSVGSYMLPQRLVAFRGQYPDVEIAVMTAAPRDALRVVPIRELHIEVPIYLTKRRDKYLSAVQTALYNYFRSEKGLSAAPPNAGPSKTATTTRRKSQ